MRFDHWLALAGVLSSAVVVSLAGSLWPPPATLGAQSVSIDFTLRELREDIQAAESGARRAQVLAVLYQLNDPGLHALDGSARLGRIPAGSLGPVRRARMAVQSVSWSENLQDTARDLIQHFVDLELALRAEDVEAAKEPARAVHSLGHRMSDEAYEWLGQ